MATTAKSATTDIRSTVSKEEWAMRVDLAAAFRLVSLFGWSDLLATHLSARVPGTHDHFLINPFGVMFDEITASSLVKCDQDGNILSPTPWTINPAGFVIHGAIHMARPDVALVIHTHTPAGCAVATQKDGLLPITQHALAVLSNTSYHDYYGIATDLAERESIIKDLGMNNVLIMRNHGLLTVGRTAGEAFMWMYRAERACRMQVAFQSCSAALSPISEEIQQVTFERNRFNNSEKGYRPIGKVEWPALLRKLDRECPDYKS